MIKNPLTPSLDTIDTFSFFNGLIRFAVNASLIIAVIAFVFMFISGGIAWITSGSDKAALEGARKRVVNSVVGFVVVLCVFAIVKFVETVFNIQLLQFDLTCLGVGADC